MMNSRTKANSITSTSAIVVMALTTLVPDADARVRCDGPYQVTVSGSIATPYCEAEDLSRIAQSRGINVSAAAIREDYTVLKRTCMELHGDSRVDRTCQLFSEAPF